MLTPDHAYVAEKVEKERNERAVSVHVLMSSRREARESLRA